MRPADVARLKEQIVADPVSRRLSEVLLRRADKLLTTPLLVRQMRGRRLLDVSRAAESRILVLAMAARLTDDPRYVARARAELLNVAAFDDWNPSHFLDVAEMSLAVSIGLDWLHDSLSPADRALLSEALRTKALRPSFDAPVGQLWWITGDNNWCQVCHGGLVAAALATWEDDPALAESVIRRARANLGKAALAAYAPDGAYPEGPGYWDYGTTFHVMLVSSLQSALGSDLGLADFPGFAVTGDYMAQVTSPTGKFYDYADSPTGRSLSPALFWFARRFDRPSLLDWDLARLDANLAAYDKGKAAGGDDRFFPLALLWWQPAFQATASRAQAWPPTSWLGRGNNPLAIHRSAWGDPLAVYLGFKGGSPSGNHGHMDASSFIVEADGVRWALDLGMQDYETLESKGIALWEGKQGGGRWTVFRIGAASHNIVVFDGGDPFVKGMASFVRFSAAGPIPHSVIDVSALWPGRVSRYWRGAALLPDRRVLLEDEWTTASAPVALRWQWLTKAKVTVEAPDRVRLEQEGKTARLIFQREGGGKVDLAVTEAAALQQPYDAENKDTRRLDASFPSPAGETGRLRVWFVPDKAPLPGTGFEEALPASLAAWSGNLP
ncbi:Heparinase II/III-like protein [Verrucomicrobium sp. GAS474]|uniref:heparinase II/III domain-containing protein n=1 Tax=Verrucomicrobium sp. GAS474 TaxID=1882831 RepID=UPI00087BD16A|nr:heparinase II/III family protein [Verrucomicrobium sp. GAS474]SDU30857.1 Heparinase II/III-like protein [Verrucomicrobium sp. GAS474]